MKNFLIGMGLLTAVITLVASIVMQSPWAILALLFSWGLIVAAE